VAVAQSNILHVGDRVALAPLNACGRCDACLRGDVIFCMQRPPVHGNFAEYTRVADINCTRIPDDLDYEHASLMGCALGPAFEALKRLAVKAADTVVVSGLGPVGLGAVALASWRGARVVGLDPEAYRRDLALTLGADQALDPTLSESRELILAASGGQGISRAVECSGQPSAERLLIDLAVTRAAIAFVGENPDTIPVSPSGDMIRKGLTLLGCWHMNVLDAPELITFLRRHPRRADRMISHRFGFDRVQEAFETFASRRAAKVLLLPSHPAPV
jgi:threonine dehydrogenase-like Zn-dependent dehydrogenase